MRKFASLAVLMALSLGAFAEEVRIRFIRPSKVLGIFMESQVKPIAFFPGREARVGRLEGAEKGLVPKGVVLTAHDSKGILQIEGPEPEVQEVKNLISLFDIEPRKMLLSLELNCPVLNVSSTTTTSLLNNRLWNVKDGTTDVDLTMFPRVNDDDTITVYVDIRRGEQHQKVIARLKRAEKLYLKLGKDMKYAMPNPGSEELQWRVPVVPWETKEEKKIETQGDIDDPETIISLQLKIEDPVQEVKIKGATGG